MDALEPKIREFCARQPRPARRRGRLRLRRRPRRADADAGDRHAARHPRAGPGGDPRARRRATCAPKPGEPMQASADAIFERRDVRRVHRLARRAPVRRPHDRAAPRRVRGRDRHDAPAHARRDPHLRDRRRRRRQRDDDAPDRLGRQGARRAPRPAARARRGSARSSRTRSRSSSATSRRRRTSAGTSPRDVELLRPDGARGQRRCCSSSARRTATTAATPTATASTSTATIGQHLTFGYGIHFCLGAALGPARRPHRARRGAEALPGVGRRLRRTPSSRRPRPCAAGRRSRSSTP